MGCHLVIPDDFGRSEASPRPEAFIGAHLAGETMGTNWSAHWFMAPGLSEGAVRRALETMFGSIIASMSPWEPGSLISQFNRLDAGAYIGIDPPFTDVMLMALDLARRTQGAFDPCLGGEVMRRGFGPVGVGAGESGQTPGAEGWAQLMPEPGRLFQPGGVTLDLSAIAKGYAVDRMGDLLESFGITQYLVEIGGEYAGRGVKPDRMPWWVDLENPYPEDMPWRLALVGQSLATSGDYRQYRISGGVHLSHIVPAAGQARGGGDLASVTVMHPCCALADGWATALFALGEEAGRALADAEGLPALFQFRDRAARGSAALTRLLG